MAAACSIVSHDLRLHQNANMSLHDTTFLLKANCETQRAVNIAGVDNVYVYIATSGTNNGRSNQFQVKLVQPVSTVRYKCWLNPMTRGVISQVSWNICVVRLSPPNDERDWVKLMNNYFSRRQRGQADGCVVLISRTCWTSASLYGKASSLTNRHNFHRHVVHTLWECVQRSPVHSV